jgi:CBS domain-containing protein
LVDEALNYGTKNPISARIDDEIESIKKMMDTKKIWDLPLVDSDNKLIGLINRHKLG